MRVLVVTTWFPNVAHDGSGIFNLRDAELLAKDHEIHVVHLLRSSFMRADEPVREVLSSGVVVERVRFDWVHPKTVVGAIWRIKHLLDGYDLLHTMAFPSLLPVSLAFPRLPWVHTEHWTGLIRFSQNFLKRQIQKLLRRALKRPNEVVAVSQMLGSIVSSTTKRPTHIIANSVEFPPLGKVVKRWSGEGELRIVSVAGLVDHKGPLEAIRTISLLQNAGINAKLTWLGRGYLSETAKRMVNDLDLSESVHLPGSVSPNQVQEYLLNAHIFMLPTEYETFGVAIAEAIAAGLPVVVTGHGGHESFVSPRVGVLVGTRDPESLAAAVYKLLDSSELLDPVGISEYAKERFSDETRQKAYAVVYAAARASQ